MASMTAAEIFLRRDSSGPGIGCYAVSASTTEFPPSTLYLTTGGTLDLTFMDGSTVSGIVLPAGEFRALVTKVTAITTAVVYRLPR
ncbi:hypothetical protein EBZ38_16225 [bacterium]|nr:hypothetical protein [bacterium]